MASADRTEKPTPKRRREAREKGQVARSKEVASALVFGGMVLFFFWMGGELMRQGEALFRLFWSQLFVLEVSELAARRLLLEAGSAVIKLALPPALLTVALVLAASFAQGSVVFTTYPLSFRPEALNPVNNVKKIFSSRGLVELLKALAMVFVVIYLVSSVLWGKVAVFQKMAVMSLPQIVGVLGEILGQVSIRVAFFLGVVAVLDLLFQRHRYEEDLKQTKQEVKEDYKDTEGQPLVKARIRRLQRELARRRMMEQVKTADVVVTNPTEYAVALKYDLATMNAPRVVAKGRHHLARRIKEIARSHDVPLVENVPLAQALYKSVEVDQEIPAELYRAVAQILAYVYQLKGKVFS